MSYVKQRLQLDVATVALSAFAMLVGKHRATPPLPLWGALRRLSGYSMDASHRGSMKALILNSSARINGNSAMALGYLKEILEHENVSAEYVNLAEMNIGMCKGCRLCFDKGETACPHKDDVLGIYKRMIDQDLIILGGPVYVEDVNGILKNWIDRMAFNCHRPGLYKQKAYIFMNSGSGASGHALRTVERAFQTWGMRVIGKRKIVLGAKSKKEEFMPKYSNLLRKDMKKVLGRLRRTRSPSFIQVMTYHIQKWFYNNKTAKESYDYQYWLGKGWLDRRRKYYSDSKIGILKNIGTKVIGTFIIKVVLR